VAWLRRRGVRVVVGRGHLSKRLGVAAGDQQQPTRQQRSQAWTGHVDAPLDQLRHAMTQNGQMFRTTAVSGAPVLLSY
jgi:hypothetical protein